MFLQLGFLSFFFFFIWQINTGLVIRIFLLVTGYSFEMWILLVLVNRRKQEWMKNKLLPFQLRFRSRTKLNCKLFISLSQWPAVRGVTTFLVSQGLLEKKNRQADKKSYTGVFFWKSRWIHQSEKRKREGRGLQLGMVGQLLRVQKGQKSMFGLTGGWEDLLLMEVCVLSDVNAQHALCVNALLV